jgi:hypothetical protein
MSWRFLPVIDQYAHCVAHKKLPQRPAPRRMNLSLLSEPSTSGRNSVLVGVIGSRAPRLTS